VKVLVCGTRKWVEQQPIEDILRLFPRDTTIIQGGASGVDNIAGYVARDILGMPMRAYPVNHSKDGPWPGAGIRRNLRMLATENPYETDGTYVDLGLAFKLTPEISRGTGHMADQMRAGEIPVAEILYTKGRWSKFLESLENKWEKLF